MDNHAGQYNDSNRAFLQAFLARGTMTYEEAKPVLAEIFSVDDGRQTRPQDVSEADFNSYVTAANDAISAFDFSIRSSLSQHDRTRIFALVNTTSDPITQLATTHTADEVAYLKRLLDAMFETHNTPRQEIMAVTSMQAVRLHKADGSQRQDAAGAANGETQSTGSQSLSMVGAEKVLKDLVREGWFEKSRAGFFTLSPRALIELKHYLLTTYNVSDEDEDQEEADERQDRIKLCAACKEIVTIGQRCSRKECSVRVHSICIDSFFRVQRSKNCPTCKTPWSGKDFVGEKAMTTTDAYLKGRRRSGGGRTRGRRSGATVEDQDDDDDDDDDEEEE